MDGVDDVLRVLCIMLEQELESFEEETEGIMVAMGNIGGIVMGMMEDDLDMDEAVRFEELWEPVEVNVDNYRLMGDPSFHLHFRLKKDVYERLLEAVANHLVNCGRVQRIRNRLDIALLMVLWILANPDTFRSVALRFGVRPGTLHFHYAYMIEVFREMAPTYIRWPNDEERTVIKQRFEAYSGFPGIVGCIDGSHNVITAPIRQKLRYRNRHHSYSMNTQAVCDHTLLVRDIHIGEVGSMHDMRVFRRSPLYQRIVTDETLMMPDEHILGDGAYTLMERVLTPFRNRGQLTPERRQYNYRLCRCRARIEHAFGKAFGQWRRMKFLHSMNVELAVDHIAACFMLHNFMILEGQIDFDLEDPDEYEWDMGDEDDRIDEPEEVGEVDVEGNDAPFARRVREICERGVAKRLRIVNAL